MQLLGTLAGRHEDQDGSFQPPASQEVPQRKAFASVLAHKDQALLHGAGSSIALACPSSQV